MADKSICIPNNNKQNYPPVDYNQWFKRLNTKRKESNYQNYIFQQNYSKTLWTSVIISQLSSLGTQTCTIFKMNSPISHIKTGDFAYIYKSRTILRLKHKKKI